MLGDELAVPTQQCVWRDQPPLPLGRRECPCDRGEEGPVVVVQFERFRVALEDSELVAEHDDLEVLGATGPGSQSGEADEEPVEETEHIVESYAKPQVSCTADISAPTGLRPHADEAEMVLHRVNTSYIAARMGNWTRLDDSQPVAWRSEETPVTLPVPADDNLYDDVRSLLIGAREAIVRSVNAEMVNTYWRIGGLIEAHLAVGDRNETYGAKLISGLSDRLRAEFGSGFEPTNLRYMRLFHQCFEIHHAPRDESFPTRTKIDVTLSWTHYRLLTRVHDPINRRRYHDEAVAAGWSTRELDRQITTRFVERGISRPTLPELSNDDRQLDPAVALRDPYVLEFIGLPDRLVDTEAQLEQALIDQLQAFLLELGRGFSFVARQQRISIDGVHYRVDLVFYHYVLKCFVLIDLKTGPLDHGDIGQMDFYVRYWEAERRGEGDQPTIGLILCAEKSEAMARYTLLSEQQSVFAAKYLPHLPSEDELKRELMRERHALDVGRLDPSPTADATEND
jgi:predicted nuclease of restriction endonuclease-like (RecB) superfamily